MRENPALVQNGILTFKSSDRNKVASDEYSYEMVALKEYIFTKSMSKHDLHQM